MMAWTTLYHHHHHILFAKKAGGLPEKPKLFWQPACNQCADAVGPLLTVLSQCYDVSRTSSANIRYFLTESSHRTISVYNQSINQSISHTDKATYQLSGQVAVVINKHLPEVTVGLSRAFPASVASPGPNHLCRLPSTEAIVRPSTSLNMLYSRKV